MNINKITYPKIFQINSKPYGKSYVKWTEKWWQWLFSIPKDQSPVLDKTGENSNKEQSGPVWYLVGTTGNRSRARRACVIPYGKSILFPIIVSQFSCTEKPSKSRQELVSDAAKDIDLTSYLEVIIDNIRLSGLSRYRIQSYFSLKLVKGNIWNLKPGWTWAASDGFWVFLKPLSEGKHAISFEGIEPNFNTKVHYNVTISCTTKK